MEDKRENLIAKTEIYILVSSAYSVFFPLQICYKLLLGHLILQRKKLPFALELIYLVTIVIGLTVTGDKKPHSAK